MVPKWYFVSHLFHFSEPFNADTISEKEEDVKKDLKSGNFLTTDSISKKLFSPHPIMWNSNTFTSKTYSNFDSSSNIIFCKK